MSEAPTKHFIKHPEMSVTYAEPEEEIDWAAYLNDGIERWNPNLDESSEDESYASIDGHDNKELSDVQFPHSILPMQIHSSEKMCVVDFKTNREELLATVQHSWYNQEQFFMEPESDWREANIGILWESHLRDQVQGLILLRPPSFITEYKVIREILWQMWCPHTSSVLELSGNNIKPRPDVTLSSVRPYSFYTFLGEFIPYIDMLDYFREFEKSLQTDLDYGSNRVCRTYQSYCNCLKSIIHPLYEELCDLEEKVRQQETTYTLLRLSDDLNKMFEPIKILKEIHDQVILDHNIKSPLQCATTLILKLHKDINYASNKLEQDLKMALFLESVYHYLRLVESWLIRDDLPDYTGEFVIEKKITSDQRQTEFIIRENICDTSRQNSFLKIFLENVLKIGKNINFLRLLRKYDIIGECQESIYEEFVEKVFKKLKEFYSVEETEDREANKTNNNIVESDGEQNFIFPVIGKDTCKTNPEMQKLENLVDTEDGFLMTAFANFFVTKPQKQREEKLSLYHKISGITRSLFPKTNFFENIFLGILEQRFTVSGLMVKNLLIEEHMLEKQFQFLKHLYLFIDDMSFPFYRRLFDTTESVSKNWANDIWLTSHLQDIFMDLYPEFYEKCSVQVKDGWSVCTDSLSACSLITVNYEISWPLNVIIKEEQIELYKEIFQFLIKLKWALHTINHLLFTDLEPKTKLSKKAQKTSEASQYRNKSIAKLIRLKFSLINILNSLQHFIFGFVFSKNLAKFELDFEKASDLNSLIESHEEFIRSVSEAVMGLKEQMLDKDKHNNVMNCVKLLKLMWNNLKFATPERINDCNKMYQQFYNSVSPIIFPVYVYDY